MQFHLCFVCARGRIVCVKRARAIACRVCTCYIFFHTTHTHYWCIYSIRSQLRGSSINVYAQTPHTSCRQRHSHTHSQLTSVDKVIYKSTGGQQHTPRGGVAWGPMIYLDRGRCIWLAHIWPYSQQRRMHKQYNVCVCIRVVVVVGGVVWCESARLRRCYARGVTQRATRKSAEILPVGGDTTQHSDGGQSRERKRLAHRTHTHTLILTCN